MKHTFKTTLISAFYLITSLTYAQTPPKTYTPSTILLNTPVVQAEKAYFFETVKNDPLNARIYKLDNGLTVYMTVYKGAPRIQTYISVRAGSKNDPANATGLAHYLEHMLFKGTDKFGTKDFAKEEPVCSP